MPSGSGTTPVSTGSTGQTGYSELLWWIPDSTATGIEVGDFTWYGAVRAGSTAGTWQDVTTGIASTSPPVVPIPGAAWLLGSGLVGLIGLGRRRARKG
jgi:hypothetical protein